MKTLSSPRRMQVVSSQLTFSWSLDVMTLAWGAKARDRRRHAGLIQHTACLRPLAADEWLLLGPVPQCQGVYMATGAGCKGILLGPAMGQVIADLILIGSSKLNLDTFDPGRFAT